ncbi:MAG TPA: alcohol dehydrogenase catalytic domain-containing protein [Candidatus Acidoferrales bacterium]|nr:alcohol dehydrogenase catalytic domain-containing protein [Candidatus Acidoferrales bacterium]
MKAAVMHARGQDLVVEELELDAPRAGEVAVRIVATGVCHSDLNGLRGSRELRVPMVLGHEGAGVVEKVGAGVTAAKVGDHVILSAIGRCGHCAACVDGRTWMCSTWGATIFSGTLIDGTTRLRLGGAPAYHWFAQSSFAERVVVPEGSVVPIRRDVALDKVALLACGVSTGLGAVFNAAGVRVGESVVVIGCGGVGVSVIVGAALAHADPIVAVDIAADKLDFARSLGATHVVDASREDAVARVREITKGGPAHAFECVGNPKTLEQLVEMVPGGGSGYIVGAAPPGTRFAFPTDGFIRNKHLHGVMQGNVRAHVDIPRYVDLYARGLLPLDRLVTRSYPLDEINAALDGLERGVGRGVVVFG